MVTADATDLPLKNYLSLLVFHLLLSCFPSMVVIGQTVPSVKLTRRTWHLARKYTAMNGEMIVNNGHVPSDGNFIHARIIMHEPYLL